MDIQLNHTHRSAAEAASLPIACREHFNQQNVLTAIAESDSLGVL